MYVGQTTQNSTRRFAAHRYNLRRGNHYNSHLQRAWNKYGEENFVFDIIEQTDSLDKLNLLEQKYILELGAFVGENGYNMDFGGSKGKFTIENREKLRVRMLGNSYTKGKRLNLSEEQINKKREMAIAYNRARGCPDYIKKKISQSLSGNKSPLYGKPGRNSKPVMCLDDGKVYHSIFTAAQELGCCRKELRKVCNGLRETIKGKRFKYV